MEHKNVLCKSNPSLVFPEVLVSFILCIFFRIWDWCLFILHYYCRLIVHLSWRGAFKLYVVLRWKWIKCNIVFTSLFMWTKAMTSLCGWRKSHDNHSISVRTFQTPFIVCILIFIESLWKSWSRSLLYINYSDRLSKNRNMHVSSPT
jgi:hypothetical protein